MKLLPAILVCGLVLSVTGSSAQTTVVAPQHTLATGFFDDSAFSSSDAPVWFRNAVASGASVVRLGGSWWAIAPQQPSDPVNPADPVYRWAGLDREVEQATAAGLTPVITATSAPPWAEAQPVPKSATPGAWKPNAADYRLFAQALATRYSGHFPDPLHPGMMLPRVRYFQAWNEPNLWLYIAPQWTRVQGAWVAESPLIYRRLLNAFYAGVKAAQADAIVVTAGTAPFGDAPGGQRIPPAQFDRILLCVSAAMHPLPCSNPAHFDVLDHHPYAVGGPYTPALNPDDVSIPDMAKLERPLAVAERTGRALPAGGKPIWATEVSYDSDPPDPQAVPMSTLDRWTPETLYELWSEGVSVVTWFLIQDTPPIPSYADSYQSGMYFLDGTAKPEQTAFRFPLVVDRRGAGEPIVWTLVPASGTLVIQGLIAGRWQDLVRTTVTRREVVERHVPASAGERFRARVGSDSSLVWQS
jgi:hypothetical protein